MVIAVVGFFSGPFYFPAKSLLFFFLFTSHQNSVQTFVDQILDSSHYHVRRSQHSVTSLVHQYSNQIPPDQSKREVCTFICRNKCQHQQFLFSVIRFRRHEVFTLFTDVDSSGLCSPGNRNNDDLRLTGFSGTLKVPPKYPEGLRCTWLISVPEGYDIRLSFTKFDLNWHGGTCGDNVEILDGQNTFSERLEKYCAYDDPSPKGVVSNGRYMIVIFRAVFRSYFGSSNQREGVEANFRAVKRSSKYYQERLFYLYNMTWSVICIFRISEAIPEINL